MLQVWEAPEEMFVDDAFQDEEFVPKVLFETRDNIEPIDDVKFSPDGRYLATGSHDNWVDIYEVGDPWRRLGRCQGHSSWISHLDWSQDSTVIQSTDAAYEMLYWKPNGQQQTQCQRDQSWHTWTCALGFPVMGIWQNGMDGSDINAVDRSKNVRRTQKDDREFLVGGGAEGPPTLSRGRTEQLAAQLEVRELENRVAQQAEVIEERDAEIRRLMERLES